MNFPFNFIIIPAVIIFTAYRGARYTKQGLQDNWYNQIHKPKWTPPSSLVKEVWIFLYIITAASVLWYWNVPVFSWVHYVAAAVLLVNAYFNFTWNKVFFIERNIAKAFWAAKILFATAALAMILIFFASPIASFLMIPYVAWLAFAAYLNKNIKDLNETKLVRTDNGTSSGSI